MKELNLKHLFSLRKVNYFKDKEQILLLRLAQDLEKIGKVEQMPKLEGKRMIMFIAPIKSK